MMQSRTHLRLILVFK